MGRGGEMEGGSAQPNSLAVPSFLLFYIRWGSGLVVLA